MGWWPGGSSPKLPAEARRLILVPASELYVSAASVWELASKHGLGRGSMPISGVEDNGFFAEAG